MFKFVVLCAFVAAASALSPNILARLAGSSSHGKSYGASKSHASSDDVHAEIISYDSDVRADGFHYGVETTNSIKADASGDANGNIHGAFTWISPEGEHVAVNYVADENGYQPNSALLPTPPPIPEAILKSLAYIAAHPSHESTYPARHH